MFSFIFWLLWELILRRPPGGGQVVRGTKLLIPLCEACRGQELKVIDYHHEKSEMKLLGHREFSDAVYELNENE